MGLLTGNVNTQVGGSESFIAGSLKRRIPSIEIARMDNTIGAVAAGAPVPPQTMRLLLKNLNGVLNVQISIGLAGLDGTRFRPGDFPAGPGTIQITPITNFPDAGPTYLRPLFQDPAQPQNENHPLPQNIPFGWEFDTRCDECEVEVVINNVWALTNINGRLLVQATIEYDGQWWDNKALQFAVSQVHWTQVQSLLVATGVD